MIIQRCPGRRRCYSNFFGHDTCPTNGNRHEQSHCFPEDKFFSSHSVVRHYKVAGSAAATFVIGQLPFCIHAILHWGLASKGLHMLGLTAFKLTAFLE